MSVIGAFASVKVFQVSRLKYKYPLSAAANNLPPSRKFINLKFPLQPIGVIFSTVGVCAIENCTLKSEKTSKKCLNIDFILIILL